MKFSDRVKAQYMVISAGGPYWTCFAYDGIEPSDLHCTHKYLGEQPEINVQQILDLLDLHFEERSYTPFTPSFDREDFFGHDQEIRVLTKDDEKYPNSLFHPDLRLLLGVFRKDDFPEYKPHVTTDEQIVDLPLTRYCLMQGDKIIKEY